MGGSGHSLLESTSGGKDTLTNALGGTQEFLPDFTDSVTNGHDPHEWKRKKQGENLEGEQENEKMKNADNKDNKSKKN